MNRRIEGLRSRFQSLRIDAFLVTNPPHLRYLSGFSGSNGAGFVSARAMHFFTDGRYSAQVKKELSGGWKVHVSSSSDTMFTMIRNASVMKAGARVGIDGNTLTYTEFRTLKKMLPGVKFLPKAGVVEEIASVKDDIEIRSIKKAVEISDRTFDEILPLIKPGVRELDIAAEISYRQRRHGAERDAFDTIVASGPRSALPHGQASSRKIGRGELVTLDFGCVVDGYHSDMTRTVAVGRIGTKEKKIYALVLEAQTRAVDAVRAGLRTRDLDAVARTIIRKGGFDKYFRHSLGHGIGLQIHEAPRISVQSRSVLKAGQVITVEPGIYVSPLGGVRIEDDVVVTDNGPVVLNRSPKELITL